MTKRWFVAGTDTEVGKTLASCALLQAATAAGWQAAGYKPVASGSEDTPAGLRNSDALALQANSTMPLSYSAVNPYTFAEATSPHIASADQQQPIDPAVLSQGLRFLEQQADWVLIEGAGGWFTPLSANLSFADWVQQEQLPVILVVGVKLGCINHALLTAQAIRQAGLPLVGWVANQIQPPGKRHPEYMATLRAALAVPCLGEIPHLAPSQQQHVGQYLDIALLNL